MIIWEKDLSLLKNLLIISEYFHPRVHLLVVWLWLLLSNQITTNPQTLLIWWGPHWGRIIPKKQTPGTSHKAFLWLKRLTCFERFSVHPSKKGWKRHRNEQKGPNLLPNLSRSWILPAISPYNYGSASWTCFVSPASWEALAVFAMLDARTKESLTKLKGPRNLRFPRLVDVAQSLENNYQPFRNKAIINPQDSKN